MKRSVNSSRHADAVSLQPDRQELSRDLAQQEWLSMRDAHRELEASRERYAELYDAAPVGYLTLNSVGSIQNINLTGARMLGLSRKRLLGHPLLMLIQRADHRKYLGHLSRLRRGQAHTSTELTIKPKGGHPISVHLISSVHHKNNATAM